jgi:hypothetical protein
MVSDTHSADDALLQGEERCSEYGTICRRLEVPSPMLPCRDLTCIPPIHTGPYCPRPTAQCRTRPSSIFAAAVGRQRHCRAPAVSGFGCRRLPPRPAQPLLAAPSRRLSSSHLVSARPPSLPPSRSCFLPMAWIWMVLAAGAVLLWAISLGRILSSATPSCVPLSPQFMPPLRGDRRTRNVMLVVAHPDDESMYVTSLLKSLRIECSIAMSVERLLSSSLACCLTLIVFSSSVLLQVLCSNYPFPQVKRSQHSHSVHVSRLDVKEPKEPYVYFCVPTRVFKCTRANS